MGRKTINILGGFYRVLIVLTTKDMGIYLRNFSGLIGSEIFRNEFPMENPPFIVGKSSINGGFHGI